MLCEKLLCIYLLDFKMIWLSTSRSPKKNINKIKESDESLLQLYKLKLSQIKYILLQSKIWLEGENCFPHKYR